MIEFIKFPKIPRLNRDIVITEKIDGTNAQIYITEPSNQIPANDNILYIHSNNGVYQGIMAGSRSRWITPKDDNFGFAKWVMDNAQELLKLGPGYHFGEWWGKGIQRGYGLETRKFSLFNTSRWYDSMNHERLAPTCCAVVPVLYMGPFDQEAVNNAVTELLYRGSRAAKGFMNPEGIIVYHTAANSYFKVTCKDDEKPKGT